MKGSTVSVSPVLLGGNGVQRLDDGVAITNRNDR
jgi:hypothetical protein